jgi:hypothetical protein
MTYSDTLLQKAYDDHSIHNRPEIESSLICGCFACFATFPAEAVWDWITPGGEGTDTGCCPYCTMDTVLGDSTGLPVAEEAFLRALNAKIFDGPVYWDQIVDPHPITGPGDWKQFDSQTKVLVPGYGKSQKNA